MARKELTALQVVGFWYDTIAGVSRVRPSNLPPKKQDDWVFDAKATRTICKMMVEDMPSFNAVVKRGLTDFHQGTANYDSMETATDFLVELGKALQVSPMYPCYKVEGTRIDPQEYTLDELAKELGYASRGAVHKFMDNHGYTIPGVGRMGKKWYMVGSTLEALKILRKSLHDVNCVEENIVYTERTTEGVNAHEV